MFQYDGEIVPESVYMSAGLVPPGTLGAQGPDEQDIELVFQFSENG